MIYSEILTPTALPYLQLTQPSSFAKFQPMTLEISTPALLFPAVSLLFLAYTNRFLHLSALVRNLYHDWIELRDEALKTQIDNLRRRLELIRWMQLLGAMSLLLCVISMVTVMMEFQTVGIGAFTLALFLMGCSLFILILEIWQSGGALQVLMDRVQSDDGKPRK